MDKLRDLPKAMLSLTLDQLRTLVFIHRTGSPRKAALALRRDQSSIIKQLDSMNDYFHQLCGEQLATKRGRGEDFAFTKTCDLVVELSQQMLNSWDETFEQRRREVGQRLVVAATTYTLGILAQIWNDVWPNIANRAELRVAHIRTKDFWAHLLDRSVDLVIGGLIAQPSQRPETHGHDFLEWDREDFCLLTNISRREWPSDSIDLTQLEQYPLIISEAGIITDAIREWYGEGYRDRLTLEPPSLDVHWIIQLLRLDLVEGFMIATRSLAKSTSDVDAKLRLIELGSGFKPLQIVSGMHGRRGERELYEKLDPMHPLAILWREFARHAPKQRGKRPS